MGGTTVLSGRSPLGLTEVLEIKHRPVYTFRQGPLVGATTVLPRSVSVGRTAGLQRPLAHKQHTRVASKDGKTHTKMRRLPNPEGFHREGVARIA
ncbi:hypothetical protein E4U55_007640 [Claviceps digitariae]|nr:hypothetical protein E4U55_007640 [Claviceps digitariae]